MNLRLLLGRTATQSVHAVLSQRWLPLSRAVPVGLSWLYDIQRFAGRRDLHTFVDAGANVGQTTRHFLRYFPAADIHAFEPVASTFARLRLNVGREPRVHCVPSALGATPARLTIALRANSELNTLQPMTDGTTEASIGSEEIAITTLDAYCAEHGLTTIDVLKLDVQGHELPALAGATQLLTAERVCFVFAEVSFDEGNPEMQEFQPLHRHLTGLGFALAGFYEPFRWGAARERLGFCNALYGHVRLLAARTH